jgi:predicted aspartyl protease
MGKKLIRNNVNVTIKGAGCETIAEALIDTGAEISMIPESIARQIGAWETPLLCTVTGVHNQSKTLPLVGVGIGFPMLNKSVNVFLVAMTQDNQQVIIGMDILKPMGITIDAETSKLSIKNKTWEAFKAVTGFAVGVGGLIYIGSKVLSSSPPRRYKKHRKI